MLKEDILLLIRIKEKDILYCYCVEIGRFKGKGFLK